MSKQETLKPNNKTMASASNRVDGKVESIGPAGQLITDIANGLLTDVGQDESVTVKFADHTTVGVYPEVHEQPEATLVASLGASGCLEIEIVGISISEMLGIKTGVPVSVSW